MDESRNRKNYKGIMMTCEETPTNEKREKNYENFRLELDEFLERHIENVHAEDICAGLIAEAKVYACFWFGCYLHLMGFLCKQTTQDLEKMFDDIRNHIDKKKEE